MTWGLVLLLVMGRCPRGVLPSGIPPTAAWDHLTVSRSKVPTSLQELRGAPRGSQPSKARGALNRLIARLSGHRAIIQAQGAYYPAYDRFQAQSWHVGTITKTSIESVGWSPDSEIGERFVFIYDSQERKTHLNEPLAPSHSAPGP